MAHIPSPGMGKLHECLDPHLDEDLATSYVKRDKKREPRVVIFVDGWLDCVGEDGFNKELWEVLLNPEL